jgi:hypothetical protein
LVDAASGLIVNGTGTGAVDVGANIAAGALIGASTSAITQGVGLATGIQNSFSWAGLAEGAIGGAIGGGLAAEGAFGGLSNSLGLGAIGQAGLQGMAASALSQGVGLATGLQKNFNFLDVAEAGVEAAGTTAILQADNQTASAGVQDETVDDVINKYAGEYEVSGGGTTAGTQLAGDFASDAVNDPTAQAAANAAASAGPASSDAGSGGDVDAAEAAGYSLQQIAQHILNGDVYNTQFGGWLPAGAFYRSDWAAWAATYGENISGWFVYGPQPEDQPGEPMDVDVDPIPVEKLGYYPDTIPGSSSNSAANGSVDAVVGLTSWVGANGIYASEGRLSYTAALSSLDPADQIGRTNIKVYYRSITPQPERALIDWLRPGTGPRPGSNMSANISNATWDEGFEVLGKVGKVSLAASVAYDIYDVANSSNRVQTAYADAGSTAGGIAGGWAGAETGALVGAGIGVWFGGVGAAPGAFIGGVVGGIAGSVGGGYYGGQAGQYLYNRYGR